MPSSEGQKRFPFISLEKAVGRASALFEGDRAGNPMAIPTAFELWGYSAKSSGGFQTIGALKMYGLIEDEGANESRRIRLTDAARRYFLDERDEERNAMLAEFALNPPLFNTLWHDSRWSAGVPADPVARSHLKIELKLNDQSARSVLSIFKDNVRFAGLGSGIRQEPLIESENEQGADDFSPNSNQGPKQMETQGTGLEALAHVANQKPPTKAIMFDMETVSGTYEFDNAEDLEEFIGKLEKIKALMPSKQ